MKKYFNHFLSSCVLIIFLIMAWACDERTYPSPDPWPEECNFFNPFTIQYKLKFTVLDELGGNGANPSIPLPNVQVRCKVIKHERLPLPDSCYWNESIYTTLTGFTDTKGELVKNFSYSYGSVGDYFILEISNEKDGYNRALFSSDQRYFNYNFEDIRSNINIGTNDRSIYILKVMKAININP